MDTDPDDGSKDALNRTIIQLATWLAQLKQSELHVVDAWTIYGNDSCVIVAATEDQVASWLCKTQARHQRALDRLLRKYDLTNLEHRIQLEKGQAAAVIPKLVHVEQV